MNIINKMCEPTRLDGQPQYTLCKVNNDNGNFSYYVQLGTQEDINWQPIHYIFDSIFQEKFYNNEEFMEELLLLYRDNKRPYNTLTAVLSSQER